MRRPGCPFRRSAALSVADAEEICTKLNRRLGLDRDAWMAMAAWSMRAEEDDPDGLALNPRPYISPSGPPRVPTERMDTDR